MPINKNVEKYRPLAQKYGAKYGIDPNVFLGLIDMESKGRTTVLGPTTKYGRALGLGQIMPFNWRKYGKGRDWKDPDAQLDVMGRLLKDQLSRNGGDVADAVRGYFGRGASDGYTSGTDYVKTVMDNTKMYAGVKNAFQQPGKARREPITVGTELKRIFGDRLYNPPKQKPQPEPITVGTELSRIFGDRLQPKQTVQMNTADEGTSVGSELERIMGNGPSY